MEKHDLCVLWFGNSRVKRLVSFMESVNCTEKNGERKMNSEFTHLKPQQDKTSTLEMPKKGVLNS
jgi:hypothetical protein